MNDFEPDCCTCIIPAAGRGSRLGLAVPKIFAPLYDDFTIWDAIHERVSAVAGKVVLVLSPDGEEHVRERRPKLLEAKGKLEIVVQPKPLGMGDAIFGASSSWKDAQNLLIVWGDQFNLSTRTLEACRDLHGQHPGNGLTLPVVRMEKPYVEYRFDTKGRLTAIQQSREGDLCQPGGWSDLGMFLLSGGDALIETWKGYLRDQKVGSQTGEINFLPFLVYLSTEMRWPVLRDEGADLAEALGINTPEDLAQARKMILEARTREKMPT